VNVSWWRGAYVDNPEHLLVLVVGDRIVVSTGHGTGGTGALWTDTRGRLEKHGCTWTCEYEKIGQKIKITIEDKP
jgi:hypothetical protein